MADNKPESTRKLSREALDEQDRIDMALEKEQRKEAPMTVAGCFLRGIIVTTLLSILMCCGGYLGVQYWIAGFTARRDAVIKKIRAKGEPLSAEDMAKFTALPEGTNDLTERYMLIVRNYLGQHLLSPEEDALPIIGSKPAGGAVPAAGTPWAQEATAKNYLSNRPWLNDAEDLAEREGGVDVKRNYAQGFALIIEDVQALRGLVRDLQLQFQVRMRDGDRAGALRSLRAMFRASRMLEREPFIVSQLVRVATHSLSVQSACEMLRDRKATHDEIASIRQMLDNDFKAALVRSLKGERATGLITLSSSDLSQLNSIAGPGSGGMPNLPWNSKVADLRPGDTAKLLELVTDAIAIAEENDFPEIMKQFAIEEDKLKKMVGDEKMALPWNRHMLPALLMPAVQASATAFARGSALEAALEAALDVEAKLQTLPPGARTKEAEIAVIQELLPVDPFTGQPMKYLVDDQGYKIYSVGRDGIDDSATGGNMNNDSGVWIERTLDDSAK